jgi:hypothetical protein
MAELRWRNRPCEQSLNLFIAMNTRHFTTALAAACAFGLSAQAQTPVSTGVVQAVAQEEGTLTLRANQPLAAPLVFHGMNKAKIETVDGKVANLGALTPGLSVTVHYAQRDNRWYVSRVVIPDPTVAATGSTSSGATGTGTTGTAAGATVVQPGNPTLDGDITTRPGQNAAGDRTVQPPGTNPANDGDITTEPGSTSTAIRQSGS